MRQHGFSLVELMISVLISMGISIAAITLFVNESKLMYQSARKEQTSQDALAAFDVIADLVTQSEMCLYSCATTQTISITYPSGVSNPNAAGTLATTNDSINIDFTVPSGFMVWPNATAPYTNNAVRIKWDEQSGKVSVSAGASTSDADSARTPVVIAGATGSMNYRVTNLDLWPMESAAGVLSSGASTSSKPTGGYLLSMTASNSIPDLTYTNAADPTGPMAHYRTVTFTKIIIPRNW